MVQIFNNRVAIFATERQENLKINNNIKIFSFNSPKDFSELSANFVTTRFAGMAGLGSCEVLHEG
jgi:hypothetical protein